MDDAPQPRERTETAARKQRREVAESLIAMVREALAKGEPPPWRTPWVGGLGRHRSGRKGSQAPYKRWNAWSTFVCASRHGYRSERWFTEAEGHRQGWTLKPGAAPASIIVPMPGRTTGDRGLWGDDWGHAWVYNRDAFDGPEPEPPPKPWDGVRGVARVITLLQQAGIDLGIDGSAYFHVVEDRIAAPAAHLFESPEAWAATLLHEVVHWSGHKSRLARIKHPWTPDEYAFEELVAEIGASMLAARLGLAATRVEDEQHRAYLAIWAKRIEKDASALVTAMELADRAAAFLEAVVPAAFSAQSGVDAAAIGDAPRVLHDGGIWRADVRDHLARRPGAARAPAFILGVDSAIAVSGWMEACDEWASDPDAVIAPTLVLAGWPGDGAETVMEWVTSSLVGDARGREGPVVWMNEAEVELPQPAAGRFEPRWLPLDNDDRNRLPGAAFVRPGETKHALLSRDPLPLTAQAFAESLIDPQVLASPAVHVVRYRSVPTPEPTYKVFVAPLFDEPLAAQLAESRMTKRDRRPWLAATHRQHATTRRVETWAKYLRATSPWLDGQPHANRSPIDRIRLCDSAPFAPVVLQAAQAVLDSLARHRRSPRSLASLVELALRRFAGRDAAQLIPLDVLMAPVFKFDVPHDDQWPALTGRARAVVQMFTICPELARGTTTLAVMLLASLDEDFDAFRAAVEAACAAGASRHNKHGTRLEKRSHSWSCEAPIRFDGDTIRETER